MLVVTKETSWINPRKCKLAIKWCVNCPQSGAWEHNSLKMESTAVLVFSWEQDQYFIKQYPLTS